MRLKNLVKSALYYGGYYRLRYAAKTSGNKRLLILMYHDLIDGGREISESGTSGYGKLSGTDF